MQVAQHKTALQHFGFLLFVIYYGWKGQVNGSESRSGRFGWDW
jgi:hypothetical protein